MNACGSSLVLFFLVSSIGIERVNWHWLREIKWKYRRRFKMPSEWSLSFWGTRRIEKAFVNTKVTSPELRIQIECCKLSRVEGKLVWGLAEQFGLSLQNLGVLKLMCWSVAVVIMNTVGIKCAVCKCIWSTVSRKEFLVGIVLFHLQCWFFS